MTLASRTVDSPIGPLTVIASDHGLRAILWPDDTDPVLDQADPAAPSDIADEAARQLGEYFAADREHFDLPLDLVGTDFQVQAWEALADIPYGETVSYGEQAERLGRPKAARAVGAANGRNPVPIVLPCHRVIGSNGSLTGFGGGIDIKRFLLQLEKGEAQLPLG